MLPGDIPTVDIAAITADTVVLDVREDDEWSAGHIDGARHVPMYQVPQHVSLRPTTSRRTSRSSSSARWAAARRRSPPG